MTASTQQTRDELLALRCRTGAPGAFADLVREMERPLLYFVAKLVGESAALDVLQDVWLKAFRTLDRLAEPRRLRPWLYKLAHGLAIDRVRKERSDAIRATERAGNWERLAPSPRSTPTTRRRSTGRSIPSRCRSARYWFCTFWKSYRWPRWRTWSGAPKAP